MRRGTTLNVEPMEGRALLSGLSYSLTTDQSSYQPGQSIQITFTETNTGDQAVTVSVSPTDFSVSEHGSPVWESNPENDGQSPTSMTLQPGQSVTQTATWEGTIAETSTQQGSTTSDAVNQFGTFTVSNPNAPQGDSATFQITDPLQGALTTDQTTYQMGQPVQLTYTETNTSDQTLTISTANPLYQILHDGQPVLPVMDPIGPSIETITPGQTITNQYTYVSPGRGPYSLENLTGAFVAEVYDVPADPGDFSADFQVAPPPSGAIVSSVTTDQPVYQDGQTVTMTFTETNVSDQPVIIPTGQTGFEFDEPSPAPNLNLEDLPGPVFEQWATLQPGQSWTQTQTWSVGNPPPGTYTLEISNAFDLNGNTATFEVSSTSSSSNTSTSGTGDDGSSSTGQVTSGDGDSSSTGHVAPLTNSTVTTNHAHDKVGESVRISLKIPGTGLARTASLPVRSREQITVLDGPRVVSRMTRRIPASTLKHLEEGRTVTLTTVWNGRPNQPGIHGLKPGSYSIDVAYSDNGGSTTITLGRDGS
jgi:hypothetical protein